MEFDIAQRLNDKQPFACLHLPGSATIDCHTGSASEIRLYRSWSELNGVEGFLIAPFQIDAETPIVLAQLELCAQWEFKAEASSPALLPPSTTLPDEAYTRQFARFMQALTHQEFEKLVLARSTRQALPPQFNPWESFRKACSLYPQAYTYIYYTPQTGMWMGSTPEVLLTGNQNGWSTVALAGTQALEAEQPPHIWSEKNRQEQAYVSAYIRRLLHELQIHPQEIGPYSVTAGSLAHLKTEFHFSLSSTHRLGDLLNLLHPTPAVCGLPKAEAYRFICQEETHHRRYYSGCLGWLRPEGETGIYVNLRCMHIENECLTLYAGGGLLPSSNLQDEWNETEKKMQTMRRIL